MIRSGYPLIGVSVFMNIKDGIGYEHFHKREINIKSNYYYLVSIL